jgi:integrase
MARPVCIRICWMLWLWPCKRHVVPSWTLTHEKLCRNRHFQIVRLTESRTFSDFYFSKFFCTNRCFHFIDSHVCQYPLQNKTILAGPPSAADFAGIFSRISTSTVPLPVQSGTVCYIKPNKRRVFEMLGEQASVSENGTVKIPRRPREYLTEGEIDRLMAIARQSDRYGHRDATAILVAFRHGLRSSELVALEWDQIDLTRKTIRLWRVKGGDPSTHYLANSELRALRRLQRENPCGPHVFVSERGGPVTTGWFRKMMARLGEKAQMPFPIHPHQLRHSCGYKYANEGKDTRSLQAYLGHRSINSTVRYTMMSPTRFKGWEKE